MAYEGHRWLYSPVWDFGSETATQALRLIGSWLFDEFPSLQVVLGHLGERIPFDMWRIDNLMDKLPVKYPAKKRVSDYMRENFHLTTSGQFHDTPFHCALVDYPYEEMAAAAAWFEQHGAFGRRPAPHWADQCERAVQAQPRLKLATITVSRLGWPNKRLQPTPYSLRSAPASRRG